MKKYYLICGAVLVALIAITASIRSESTSFYGIADTKEIVINSESPVEIRKIRVMPGQPVRLGDTLVELCSQDLDLRINEISHQFDELKTRKTAHANMSRSEIRQLKVQQEERANAIRAQLQPLEAQYEINKKLMSELKSIKKGDGDAKGNADSANPLAIRIESLKKELERALDSSQITVDRLSNELSYSGDPLADQAKRLEEELKMLLIKKKNLYIVAQISGLIGTVDFKDGEKISPFTPILTLHAESPSIVRGYIHENAYSRVRVGQKVLVKSLAESGSTITGDVTGVGSRIVEYPVRLRKAPDIQVWGREIIIKIPEENKLLLGEKVLISLSTKKIPGISGTNPLLPIMPPRAFAQDRAAENPLPGCAPSIIDIKPDSSIKDVVPIEASGVIYLSDLKEYLVVSDETERKGPVLYLMNSDGHIGKEVRIEGLDKINDMESVTADDRGTIYILSSQSQNKKGELSPWRRLFVRCVRNGEKIRMTNSVFLADLLKNGDRRHVLEPGEHLSWIQKPSGARFVNGHCHKEHRRCF
jgi:multidrug resistance efflux pump